MINSEIQEAFDLIKRNKPEYDQRTPQIELASQIYDAIMTGKNFIGQGATGVGKSYAYLIAAIISGNSTIVTTSTKQLANQLVSKDLTFLQSIFPKMTFAELRGVNNYLCPYNAYNELENYNKMARDNNSTLFGGDKNGLIEMPEFKETDYDIYRNDPSIDDYTKALLWILDQANDLSKRDKRHGFLHRYISEIPYTLNDYGTESSSNLYATTTSCTHNCSYAKSQKCPLAQEIDLIDKSQIVVTTHAAQASWLDKEDNSILTYRSAPRTLWIADEAHELENVLINMWSASLKQDTLIKDLKNLSKSSKWTKKVVNKKHTTKHIFTNSEYMRCKNILDNFNDILEQEFEQECENEYDTDVKIEEISPTIENLLTEVKSILDDVEPTDHPNQMEEIVATDLFMRKSHQIVSDIADILDTEPKIPRLLHIQKTRNLKTKSYDYTLYSTVLEASENLAKLTEHISQVYLSATIKTNGSFKSSISNLGLDRSQKDVTEYDTGAIFEYKKQGILYIPSKFPLPSGATRRDHFEKFAQSTLELIVAAGGGALVLTTTSKEARDVVKFLKNSLPNNIHVHSYFDSPNKEQIVRDFSDDLNSVLVGTKGLFQGIDIPGDSLRLVCVNKIPFAPPSPVSKELEKLYEEAGRNAFMELSVAEASNTLAQACGRLIRTNTDRGIVAIFDPRLSTARYGGAILKSIPDFYRCNDFDQLLKSAGNICP
ncbi:MAG: ATP-dependent DNA helicase [Bifidobacteriaceae bacterium]|jgi:Rad3-related DNA helicase|nr:ATP-dependent DNA helicase [Bifidobacteriaceae bacterium]